MRGAASVTFTVTLTVLSILAVAWIAYKAVAVIVIVLLSVIVASAIAPLAKRLRGMTNQRISRSASLLAAYLLVLAFAGSALGYYAYLVSGDVRGIVAKVPQMAASLSDVVAALHARYPWLPEPGLLLPKAGDADMAAMYVGRLYTATLGAVGLVWGAITVLILSYYISVEAVTLRSVLLQLLPERQRETMQTDLGRIAAQLARYVRGQLTVSSIMGILATAGSAAVGLHFPFLIGACVALSDFIPLVGGVVGSIPAIAIALTQERWQLIAIVIFFVALQQFENYILIPRVMKAAVGISPVITLVAALIGATAFGIGGALLAIPIASAFQVVAPMMIALARGRYGSTLE